MGVVVHARARAARSIQRARAASRWSLGATRALGGATVCARGAEDEAHCVPAACLRVADGARAARRPALVGAVDAHFGRVREIQLAADLLCAARDAKQRACLPPPMRRSGAHCLCVCTVAHESIESLASDDEKILQTQQAARFSAAPELAHPPLDSAGSSGELYAGGPPLGRDSPRAPPLPAPLQAPLAADSHRLSRDPHRAAPERPRPRAYVSSKRLLGLGVAARETAKKISDGIVARRAARVARRPAVRSATVVTGRLPSLLGHMQAARPGTLKRKQVAPPQQAASGTRTRTSTEAESGRISSMGSS